jgi:GNAT superfamily N-acetyltransferase
MVTEALAFPRTMQIEEVIQATPEVHEALARLLPQLNAQLPIPTMDRLQAIMADPASTLLVARDGEEIVGTTTLIVYTTPFWIKARLDEVVVDASARGKGVASALVKASLEIARKKGVEVVELQSGVQRDAANRLYPSLGFKLRETNVYRIVL